MDLAELGIVATAKGVTESSDQLDKLTGSAGRAEDSVTKFNSKAGDGASATSVMNREVGASAGIFSLTGTAILGAVAALAAFAAGALSIEKFVSATAEAEEGQAQLAAALKSTRGVSGQTIETLNAHAEALQALTTYEDDAINKSQALLLTFTKIGGDVFPKATEAITNMAARMGGDLHGATIQIGKALNDPIKGVSALSKAGVQFTEDQKGMIKTMVEANNIVGAQTIILKELETQFGGSAEAARNNLGGAIKALQNVFGNLFEVSGPAVESLRLAIEDLITAMSSPGFKAFANMIGTVIFQALTLVIGLFAQLATAVGEFWDYAGPFLTEFSTVLYRVASVILPAVWEGFTTLWGVVKPIIQYFLEGWKQVYDILASILGLQSQVKVPDTTEAAAMASAPAAAVPAPAAVNDAADKLNKAITTGGNTASATMNKAATTAGATVASTAAEAAKVGAGALANSFGEGAESIAGAGTESADGMAAAIEAQGNIMAAKFEGTGRNIYDLFNNWGDSFINSFGVSIGDLLIQFQRAQTAQLNAQAALLAAQAKLTEEQAKYLRDNGEMPGTAGSGGGSGNGGGGSSSTGGFTFGDLMDDMWGNGGDKRGRKKNSDNDNRDRDRDRNRTRLDERGNVPLKIINQMDPREQLDNIRSARGERTIMNVMYNKRRSIKAILG